MLHVKNLQRTENMLEKLFISRMLQKIFHAYVGILAPFDVRKLIAHQIGVDDGHGLLDVPLVFLQHFGIGIGKWSLCISIHSVPKVHESQNHLHFEFLS